MNEQKPLVTTNLALPHQLRLAIGATVLAILFRLLLIVFVQSSMSDIIKIWFGIPLNLAILALDFFTFYIFKNLLNQHFHFHRSDNTIYAYLGYLVVFFIISIFLLFNDLTILASLVQFVGYVLLFILAVQLQNAEKKLIDWYGWQPTYASSLKALSVVTLLGLSWLLIEDLLIPEKSEIPIVVVILLTILSFAKLLLFVINTFFFIKILFDGTILVSDELEKEKNE